MRAKRAQRVVLAGLYAAVVLAAPAGGQLPDLSGPPSLRIGELDGPPERVFGRIAAVEVGPDGDVFVLDAMAHEVRWFGPDGRFRGRAGGGGQGPGELRAPRDMALDGEGRVHVLGPGNGRVTTWEPRETGLAHVGETRVPFATSLCAMGARRFVLVASSRAAGGLIHELDAEGGTVGAFAPAVEPDPDALRRLPWALDYLRDAYNGGRLLCDGASGNVIHFHAIEPRVRAFSAGGTSRWSTVLADFRPIHLEPGSRPLSIATGADPETGTAQSVAAVASVEGHLVVTLHEGSLEDPEGRLEARILRLSDGAQVGRTPVPVKVVAVRDGRVYGYTGHPFPAVHVY